jgi:hypothetical protein
MENSSACPLLYVLVHPNKGNQGNDSSAAGNENSRQERGYLFTSKIQIPGCYATLFTRETKINSAQLPVIVCSSATIGLKDHPMHDDFQGK